MNKTKGRYAVVVLVLVLIAVWVIGIRESEAHAGLDYSNPAADEVLSESPELVEIWFTQEVASDELIVAVLGPDGSRVDNQDGAVDLCEASRKRVSVTLPPGLPDGEYIVQWQTLSAEDGEMDSSSFKYFVQGGSASPEARNSSPVASPGASPEASPTGC